MTHSSRQASSLYGRPTLYHGVWFRSRLESQIARLMDRLDIAWAYETQMYELDDGTWYLPDFWLQSQHIFVEVKGILDVASMKKVAGLAALGARTASWRVLLQNSATPRNGIAGKLVYAQYITPSGTLDGADSMAMVTCRGCGTHYWQHLTAAPTPCPGCDSEDDELWVPRIPSPPYKEERKRHSR